MSDGLYGVAELRPLLQSENIFDGVVAALRRIWDTPGALSDRQLANSEYQTRLLEQELATLYPPIYDKLIAQTGEHPLTELEHGCGIVMDALSLREGFRLAEELTTEFPWTVTLEWAPVERVPTETTFMARAWFDAHAPSAVSREDYRFLGEQTVPQLPTTDPAYVWTRHPDKRLENALTGNYATETIEEIYNDTKALLVDLINESVHEQFLVTSDHGYVNHLGNSPYSMTEEQADTFSKKFNSRFREVANGQAYRLLEQADIIKRVGEHYLVQGHYTWTKPGATKKIMHGGLSLMEALTPVLRIDTTGGT